MIAQAVRELERIQATYRGTHRRLVGLVCRRAERALVAGVVPSPAEARVA